MKNDPTESNDVTTQYANALMYNTFKTIADGGALGVQEGDLYAELIDYLTIEEFRLMINALIATGFVTRRRFTLLVNSQTRPN